MYNQTNGYGYGKKSIWKWILIYVIVGGAIYGVVYYFYFGKNGGYTYSNSTQNNSATNQPIVNTKTPPASTPSNTTATQGTTVLNARTDANLGTYLIATNGMTLYKFSRDTAGVSNCSGQCAANWPPYTVSSSGSLKGSSGINGSISTITRSDGTKQIAYNGMPLYFWVGDSKSGDATGQNVNGFTVVKP